MKCWWRNDRLKDFLQQSNNQASKYFKSSMSKRRGEVQDFVCRFSHCWWRLQLSVMMTSLVLLASESSDHASKEFGNWQLNRIGRVRIRLYAAKVLKQENSHSSNHKQTIYHNNCVVHVPYATPQAHGIVNVALRWEYSPGIIFVLWHLVSLICMTKLITCFKDTKRGWNSKPGI
jgi:hypothetical protein